MRPFIAMVLAPLLLLGCAHVDPAHANWKSLNAPDGEVLAEYDVNSGHVKYHASPDKCFKQAMAIAISQDAQIKTLMPCQPLPPSKVEAVKPKKKAK